jgi:hypothetical protein
MFLIIYTINEWFLKNIAVLVIYLFYSLEWKARLAHHLHDTRAHDANRTQLRQIHAGCASHPSANPTQMLRGPVAARGARNKGCCFWTPLYICNYLQDMDNRLMRELKCADNIGLTVGTPPVHLEPWSEELQPGHNYSVFIGNWQIYTHSNTLSTGCHKLWALLIAIIHDCFHGFCV